MLGQNGASAPVPRFQAAKAKLSGDGGQGDPYADRGWVRDMPGPVKGWLSEKDLPTPTSKSFRHWWANREDVQ